MDIPPALAPYAASSLKAFPDGVKHGKRIPNPTEILKPQKKEKPQRNAKGREKRISFHQRELAFDFFAPSRLRVKTICVPPNPSVAKGKRREREHGWAGWTG
jgi:hypothetical protein